MNEQIVATIKAAIPDAEVHSQSDDGTHFTAIVVSPSFEGMMLVKQHQMVLGALKADFDSERLHALQLKTLTPAEWQAMQEERPSLSVV